MERDDFKLCPPVRFSGNMEREPVYQPLDAVSSFGKCLRPDQAYDPGGGVILSREKQAAPRIEPEKEGECESISAHCSGVTPFPFPIWTTRCKGAA
jgi:hypothetical protein